MKKLMTKFSVAAVSSTIIALNIGLGTQPVQGITIYTTDFINNAERTNFNGFEGLPESSNFSSIYTEDGITVEQINGNTNGISTVYQDWGAEGLRSWYANGGDMGYTKITRQDNTDFQNIGFLFGSGYSRNSPITYVYNLLQDGLSVLSGTIFKDSSPNYLGFGNGGFDEVLLAAYFGNNPNQTLTGIQALAIDSIELSATPTSVPEPTSLVGILVVAALGASSALKKNRNITHNVKKCEIKNSGIQRQHI
jgi:hypothetical protein